MTATEDLVIRPAERADRQVLAEVYLASRHAAPMPPPVRSDEAVHTWLDRALRGTDVWTALEDDVVVGFVAFTETWLDELYVAPGHQRHGVGSALLDVVKTYLPDGFSLWVFAANTPARSFYRRHGLVELEQTDGAGNEEGAPDVRMAWAGREPLAFLRGQIDEVDDDLALLIARRSALTWAVQDHKAATGAAGGVRGRDPDREAAIVDRMAAHVPALTRDQLVRVMHTVIEESLAAWERQRG